MERVTLQDKDFEKLVPQPFGKIGMWWVAILLVICGLGLVGYIRQLIYGLGVTGLRDYASWGIYISNFVFFVAISLVGSLITAVLRLTKAAWSTPLTRIAEIIAVSAILFASIIIIVDMGRPDRFMYLFIFGRLQSPILWDVIVITTYLVLSLLLLYFPLLPDLSILKENPKGYVHEDFGVISYDKSRKIFVFRQFHIEGFVNQYILESISPDGKTIVFITETIENIPKGWRGRETYTVNEGKVLSEVFDLAEPNKDFELYTKASFIRTK